MKVFLYCGLPVQSNFALPELPHLDRDEWGITVKLMGSRLQSMESSWQHHWLSPGGEVLISHCKQDSHHWLRFPNLADFRITENGDKISCFPVPEVPIETLRHLLLDQVLPRCLAHQGRIMLHASAVLLEQGVLLFIGDSGAGKSTLAGDFHQAGSPVLSDDCVWVKEQGGQITANPTYGGLRLWEDSLEALFARGEAGDRMAHYSTKRRVQVREEDMQNRDLPILAVIVLTPELQNLAREITLERVSHREAFMAMMKQTFQLDLGDLERMRRHVESLGRITPRLNAFRLTMPRDYALLPSARAKILEIVL